MYNKKNNKPKKHYGHSSQNASNTNNWQSFFNTSAAQSAYAKNTKVSEEANELMEGSTPDSPPFEDTVPINSQSAFASVSFSHGGGANGKAGTPDFGAPGSSYNNKKANEEFLRAMSSLVDRDTDAHSVFMSWNGNGADGANVLTEKFGDVLMRKQ